MLFTLVLGACASHRENEAVETRTQLAADWDENPDLQGRPSPIVVRVFQLRGDAEFSKADFFTLYGHEKEVLGPSLLGVDEYVLHPGEKREARIGMLNDTRYVATIAAFRDISLAKWRVLQLRPGRSIFAKERISVGVSRVAVSLSVKH
jgi:type VI secretion system protein VasD